ncbi:hypothetical protein BAUCODRAFT_36613 [Baudoinia panamericana UAMH 10762]|uniref:Uncharacterized protein n=1 Tax=Baudoinia panamericana (strain UAMH 10762) TaxID=717646 RepID=M2MRN8_BAUPA|nr:uncharacterized protein BAUCODRAFT_36613 [Baudoinia panamericana UAMH 10762]EMC94143.1 hypothetical protein BAUCODRAFT_36613 [Baudoinia panamericana UAMH 10762]
MTAAKDSDSDAGSDHQHWADDDEYIKQAVIAAPGYDSHNGLRSHTYYPSQPITQVSPKFTPAPPVYYPPYPQPIAYQPYQAAAQYGFIAPPPHPAAAYPTPAYYTYAVPPQPQQPQPMSNYYIYQPAYSAPAVAPIQGNVWTGRTKAQVEEDNMKIAAKEGANDKRKIVPTDIKDDQMCWCVELDGSHTLRTFISIKELKGEWKKDPRFQDSYYFLRVEEEAKKKD